MTKAVTRPNYFVGDLRCLRHPAPESLVVKISGFISVHCLGGGINTGS